MPIASRLKSVFEPLRRRRHINMGFGFMVRGNVDYSRILVAVDGSKTAENAAVRALEIAKLTGASVIALHVVPSLVEPLKEEGHRVLDTIAYLGSKFGVQVDKRLREGKRPAETIVRLAEEAKVDLVVMASKSKTGIARRLLGSNAEYVVRHAICNVLVIKE